MENSNAIDMHARSCEWHGADFQERTQIEKKKEKKKEMPKL